MCARFWGVRSGVASGDAMYRRHGRGNVLSVRVCRRVVWCVGVWWVPKSPRGTERRVEADAPQWFATGTQRGGVFARDACTLTCVRVCCSVHCTTFPDIAVSNANSVHGAWGNKQCFNPTIKSTGSNPTSLARSTKNAPSWHGAGYSRFKRARTSVTHREKLSHSSHNPP